MYSFTQVTTTQEWTTTPSATFQKIIEGQLYFNSTSNAFKETITDMAGATWASGGNLSNGPTRMNQGLGNAGTQTLTVSVRALATKELTAKNAVRIIFKETFVGGINGFIFAILIGLISSLWFGDYVIGLIIALAMILNLILAGFAGTLIPLTLNKFNIDPALASGVILTTITDVFGFLSFLGLASIFII